jgi:hypothetical protein
MSSDIPAVLPPYVCIFCGSRGPFTAEEHIVPHSLGNDLVVLGRGWVCDSCNNIFSAFESRVLYSSILGAERCRMGVVTKRGQPAHSKTHGVSWFAQPSAPPNHVTAEASWESIPVLPGKDASHGMLVFPLHDDSNEDIARLLLKIGIEIVSPMLRVRGKTLLYDLSEAKRYLVTGDGLPWPYFVLRDCTVVPHLTSVFSSVREEHEYIRKCGFDAFLHEVDGQPVLFFAYGSFFAAISLSSRNTAWRSILVEWGASHVGCPAEYAQLFG